MYWKYATQKKKKDFELSLDELVAILPQSTCAYVQDKYG
jgi:hypothetical protein